MKDCHPKPVKLSISFERVRQTDRYSVIDLNLLGEGDRVIERQMLTKNISPVLKIYSKTKVFVRGAEGHSLRLLAVYQGGC